ncbi:hypothetical protein HK102_004836, partial [Quaeritorhiza haematococci]
MQIQHKRVCNVVFVLWMFAFGARAFRLLYKYQHGKSQMHRFSVAPTRNNDMEKQYRSLNRAGPGGGRIWQMSASVTDAKLAKLCALLMLVLVLMMGIIQYFTTTHRIFPVIDMNMCQPMAWEYAPLYLIAILFYAVACPYALWKLRWVQDAYGINTELRVTFLSGCLLMSMFLLQNLILDEHIPEIQLYFNGCLWPVLSMVVSHCVSVVLPLIQTYIDDSRYATSTYRHNMNSFLAVLSDPASFAKLKEFAVQDFSVENVLFIEAINEIEQFSTILVLGNSVSRPSSVMTFLLSGKKQTPADKAIALMTSISHSPAPPLSPSSKQLLPFSTTATDQSSPTVLPRNMPVPREALHRYIRFYHMFIKEGSPCEVNLSAHCRQQVNKAFGNLERTYKFAHATHSNGFGPFGGHGGASGVNVAVGVFDKARKEVLHNLYQ